MTKYVIIIPDGCADEPQAALDSRTPLQAANVPNMDAIASDGIVGTTNNVPRKFTPGSEVANMTLFGYDPHKYFTGRAPIEAAAQGIKLGANDWAIRCNIVTIIDQIMVDFTAGHISTDDSRALLAAAQNAFGTPEFEFVPGVSYRNLLIYRPQSQNAIFSSETKTIAPHDLTDLSVADAFPRGPGSGLLTEFMDNSIELFKNHPLIEQKSSTGQRIPTNIWLWGLGKSPTLQNFQERFGLRGAMITAVDLLRGLAALVGWDRIEVDGATGYLDTNYAGKGQAAVEALDDFDIVCVHVEATDEASHEGRGDAKIAALEAIDKHIVGPVYEKLKSIGDYRIWVLPDHPTFVRTKKHEHGHVPFIAAGTGIAADAARTYDEVTASKSSVVFDQGWLLMDQFIRGKFQA
jgi:2,3-bisphosphoglycerate-independent phosphoglycerate mutase